MIREVRTILLVEDSLADAEMTIDALREARIANPIVHVEDGVEALDFLHARNAFAGRAEGDPVVVLLDIKMPRKDGIEVLREIRGKAMKNPAAESASAPSSIAIGASVLPVASRTAGTAF